jgi:hypothetical protein
LIVFSPWLAVPEFLRQVSKGNTKRLSAIRTGQVPVSFAALHSSQSGPGWAGQAARRVCSKRASQLPDRRHGENHRLWADLGTVRGQEGLREIVLDGMNEDHNEQYYAVEDQRFLGGGRIW